MKKHLVIYSALFIGTAALFGCIKGNEQSPREKLLTAKEWKLFDITRKSILNPNQDSSILKACTSDDRIRFSANKHFGFYDNTTTCDTTIFQYDSGSWRFFNSENALFLDGNRKDQTWSVLTLNDSILKVQWFDSVSVENKILKTITLKNK